MMCRGSQKFFWIFNAGRARHVRSEKSERTLLECNGKLKAYDKVILSSKMVY